MRWGVYARESVPGAIDLRDGFNEIGHRAVFRSLSDWGRGCVEKLDAVVVFGLQGKGPQILAEYQAAGVPVVVCDYGYLRRTNNVHDWKTGHWQLSVGGLNRPPSFECPADRFESLGLKVQARGGDPKGYVLLCVQTVGDASHGMGRDELQAWCLAQQAKYPGLVIRPHPQEEHLDYGIPRCPAASLDEALAGARLVVTANSNTGHEALMAGVPVVGTHPAAWDEMAGEKIPSVSKRLAYFHRLAYGQ